MNTDKNSYIYIFSAVVVVVVAVVLSLAATLLGPSQKRNLDAQKMQDILRTIRVDVSRDEAVRLFRDYVKDMKAVGYTGQDVDGGDIFNMNLTAERKKPAEEQALPGYVAEKNSSGASSCSALQAMSSSQFRMGAWRGCPKTSVSGPWTA